MDVQTLTYLFVGASFALYIGIAIASRAASTSDFYVAGGHVHPVANGWRCCWRRTCASSASSPCRTSSAGAITRARPAWWR